MARLPVEPTYTPEQLLREEIDRRLGTIPLALRTPLVWAVLGLVEGHPDADYHAPRLATMVSEAIHGLEHDLACLVAIEVLARGCREANPRLGRRVRRLERPRIRKAREYPYSVRSAAAVPTEQHRAYADVLDQFSKHGLTFDATNAVLSEDWRSEASPAVLAYVCRRLCREGILDPALALDPRRVQQRWGSHSGPSVAEREQDPREMLFWLRCMGGQGLSVGVHVARRLPVEQLGPFLLGVAWEWNWAYRMPPHPGRSVAVQRGREPLRDLLRIAGDAVRGGHDDSTLRGALSKLVWEVWVAHDGEWPENAELSALAERTASSSLGSLRSELGTGNTAGLSDDGRLLLTEVSRALAITGGMWKALRAQLLVFRALREEAVGPDLRYWQEKDLPPPPDRTSWVAERVAILIHSAGSYVPNAKEQLDETREQLSRWCLDRLKTRKGSNHPVERSATWRYHYVRVVRELRLNPGGRGHKTLYWISRNDEDADVRGAAKAAYKELRHGFGTDARSHRRALLAAFWWLRQAHRLDLGLDVDEHGARRTHDKEGQRTDLQEKQAPSS